MASKMIIGTPEFHAERRSGIGASEVGAVLGVNPWSTPVDVWMEKMGRKDPFEGNELTEFGQLMEDHIAKKYAEVTGRKVRRCNYTLRHGIIICHVDRLVHDEGVLPAVKDDIRTDRLLECKTGRDEWEDGVPAMYEAQAFAQMACCPTVQVVDFGAFFRSNAKFKFDCPVGRDDAVIEEISLRLEEWWVRHVVEGLPPDPINEDDCKVLWGRHKDEKVTIATPDAESAVRRLAMVKKAAKVLEESEKALKLAIFSCMQDASVLNDSNGTVKLATWKNNKDSEKTDWAAVSTALAESLAEEHAMPLDEVLAPVVKKHTQVSEGARVLRLAKVKKSV